METGNELSLELFSEKRTNYDIVAEILHGFNKPMKIKQLYSLYLKNGGKAQRTSFDVMLGSWVKHPKKRIDRVGMGLYQYLG